MNHPAHPQTAPPDGLLPGLAALARALYPHRGLPDAPYERVASRLMEEIGRAPESVALVSGGVAAAEAALGPLPLASIEARTAWLANRQGDPFFALLRDRVCFHLYDDREVWEHMGYPGPSYALGGYIERGFDDLPWLPRPRVEESAEPLVEIGPLPAIGTGADA